MKYIVKVGLLLIPILLHGCGTSPLSRHSSEGLMNTKLNSRSIVLLTDAVIVNGGISDTNIIDEVENKRIAKITLQMFAGRMNELGYAVKNIIHSSTGLMMNQAIPYKIITSPYQRENNSASLDVGNAPFFVHEYFKKDTLRGKLLAAVYSSLLTYQQNKGGGKEYIPAAPYLAKSIDGDMLGVIFITGFTAGVTNEFGKYVPPSSKVEEKVGIKKVSQYSLLFFLIDGKTGEILWDDETSLKGGLMHDDKLNDMVNTICNRLL